MSDTKETFEWNLERAADLIEMTDDKSHALATMALIAAVGHLIKALQIQSSEDYCG